MVWKRNLLSFFCSTRKPAKSGSTMTLSAGFPDNLADSLLLLHHFLVADDVDAVGQGA
jgi:hypothetical protein